MLAAGVAVFGASHRLLNILLRYNDFAKIQKAVVEETGSGPPVTVTFSWCSFGFGRCFGILLGPATELAVTGCDIKSTFHHISQSD